MMLQAKQQMTVRPRRQKVRHNRSTRRTISVLRHAYQVVRMPELGGCHDCRRGREEAGQEGVREAVGRKPEDEAQRQGGERKAREKLEMEMMQCNAMM